MRKSMNSIESKHHDSDPGLKDIEMGHEPQKEAVLVSEFSNDPDMLELLELFVDEIPERVEAFEMGLAHQDVAELARLAHQLRGAAGGYGFPTITECAARLEQSAKSNARLEQLTAEVLQLISLCRRARAQAP